MKVINLKKTTPMWDGETIYIGRKSVAWNLPCSKWHNPYTVDKAELENYRDMLCHMYEVYIRKTPELWNSLEELDGKTLACWCHPKNCHGDVLIRLLNEKKLNNALTE